MLFKSAIVYLFLAFSESLSPTITLSDGNRMPAIGLGTYRAVGNQSYESVVEALNAGYRHIDTAYLYENEEEIGRALRDVFSQGKIKRQDVFVVSKLWHTFHSRPLVTKGIQESLKKLGLEYLDLYLIHFPFGLKEGTDQMTPTDANGTVLFSNVDYLETWKGMEDVHRKGLAKSVGLSNFNSKQIDRILANAEVRPTVNQVECHPYLNQKPLLEFCRERNISLTAYSPLGTGRLLNESQITEIAERYNVSAAQVLIRYQIQRDIAVIPKATKSKYIYENIDVFGFTLTEEEMKSVDSLNKNLRYNVVDYAKNHKYYPFNIPF